MKDHPFSPKIDDDHDCQVRRSFASKDQAAHVAERIYNRSGVKRTVERCKHCSGWHLGNTK